MKKINIKRPKPENLKKLKYAARKYGKVAIGAVVVALAKDISDAMKK